MYPERSNTYQRLCVSALIGDCEAIVADHVLTEPAEQSLRKLIAATLSAYGMPSKEDLERRTA